MAARLSLPAVYSWQPQTVPRLARGGLTEGIIDAIIPAGANMVSVRRDSTVPLLSSGGPVNKFNKYGVATECISSTKYHYLNSAPEPLRSSNSSLKEISMMVLVEPSNVSPSATQFMFAYGLSTNNNPMFSICNGVTAGRVALRIRDTAGVNVEAQQSGSSLVIDTPRLFIASRSESRNRTFIISDRGEVLLDTTAGSAVGAVTFDRTCVGGYLRGSFALQLQHKNSLSVSWSRALTFDEAIRLSFNPWEIFDAPARPPLLDTVAAAATVMPPPFLNIQQAVNRATLY